jgi:hypothetical protein
MKNATNVRANKDCFYKVLAQTSRDQKIAQIQKFNPRFIADLDTDLDGILYGLHLMCTSPCI